MKPNEANYEGINPLVDAAPDLLEACKSMVATFHDHPDRDEVSLAMARDAIAKAEGRLTTPDS